MGFFSFLTLAVVLGCGVAVVAILADAYTQRMKSRDKQHELAASREIHDRLDAMETRLRNLETIVIDKEKGKRFEEVL